MHIKKFFRSARERTRTYTLVLSRLRAVAYVLGKRCRRSKILKIRISNLLITGYRIADSDSADSFPLARDRASGSRVRIAALKI